MNFSWFCPFCNHNATIGEDNYSSKDFTFNDNNKYGYQLIGIETITCPNTKCQEYTLTISIFDFRTFEGGGHTQASKPKKIFVLFLPPKQSYFQIIFLRQLLQIIMKPA